MKNGYKARESLDRLISQWWIIFGCMIIGAAIGWIFHLSQPPLYESRSIISVGINYSVTGLLTDLEEDHVLSVVGEVLVSDAVISSLQKSLDTGTFTEVGGDLRSQLFAEREGYRWVLRVRAAKEENANEISSRWADVTMITLEEALSHSRNALLISRQINELETCFTQSVTNIPAASPCVLSSADAIRNYITQLREEYEVEQALGSGLIPAMAFTLNQVGNNEGTPVTFRTAELLLVGAMLGFIAGVILVLTGAAARKHKVKSGAK